MEKFKKIILIISILTLVIALGTTKIPVNADDFITCSDTNFLKATENIFDLLKITNGYVLTNKGKITKNSAYFTSDYIEVEPEALYSNNNTNHVCFYTVDNTFINKVNVVTSFITPANCGYIRIDSCIPLVPAENVMIVKGSTIPAKYLPHYKLVYEQCKQSEEITNWSGAKWVSYGDSITASNGWQPDVVNKLGLAHTKRGIGGTTFAETASIAWVDANGLYLDRPPASQPPGSIKIESSMCNDARIATIPVDTEIITIMGGTNDYAMNIPLGTAGTLSNTTYKGAMSIIIEKILTKMPTARIVFMTPPFENLTPNSLGLTMEDYANAVIEVAHYYAMPVIDVYGECGWNAINSETYLSDGVHPNTAGYARISSLVIGKLKALN
jgi:hypothetical protein